MKKVLCIKDVTTSLTGCSVMEKKGTVYEVDNNNSDGDFYHTEILPGIGIHCLRKPGEPWFDEHFKLIEDDVVEYKVVKNFGVTSLSKEAIEPKTFLWAYKTLSGLSITPKWVTRGWPVYVIRELLRLGYLEEIVVDPVVEIGTGFKHRLGIYMVCWQGCDSVRLTLVKKTNMTPDGWNIGSCEGDGCHYSGNETTLSEMLCGSFMELKDFKPCKINVSIDVER